MKIHFSHFLQTYTTTSLLFLYAFLLPTQFGIHFWPDFTYLHGIRIDYLAPFISTFDITCIVIVILTVISIPTLLRERDFLSLRQQQKLPLNNIFFYASISFLSFFLINILFSISPIVTLLKFLRVGLYLMASYLLVREFQHNKEISPPPTSRRGVPTSHKATEGQSDMTEKLNFQNYFVYGLFASTVLVFILTISQFVEKSSIGGLWYFLGERQIALSLPGIAKMTYEGKEFLRPYSTFSHPNSMGGFYLVLYFLIDWIMITNLLSSSGLTRGSMVKFLTASGMTKQRVMLWATQVLSIFLVILSFSKVAIFTFVFLSFVSLLRDKAYRGCIICFVARISIFLFLLFFIFLFSGDPYSLDKRLFLASQSFEVIKNNLLFGTGFGTSLIAQSKLAGAIPGRFTDTLQPVHNIYLLLISEVGIIGICLLAFVQYINKRIFTKWKELPVMAISAVLLTGLFDHYWLTLPQNFALLCLVFSLVISSSRPPDFIGDG